MISADTMNVRFVALLFLLIGSSGISEIYANIYPGANAKPNPGYTIDPPKEKLPMSPGWVYLGRSEYFNIFVNTESIVKRESSSDILMLLSSPNLQRDNPGVSYKSSEVLYRIDCKEKTSKVIHSARFSDENGQGRPIGSTGEGMSFPITPDSLADDVMKMVCPQQEDMSSGIFR